MKPQAAWATDEAIGELHRLWDNGVGQRRIAALLGTTEAAAVAMARRTGCQARSRGHVAEWTTPDAIERLRAEWARGTPTEEIGALFGVSTNAIIGKAHRLRLPHRPRRGGGPRGAKTEPAKPVSLAAAVTEPAPIPLPAAPCEPAPPPVAAAPVSWSPLPPLPPLQPPREAARPVIAAPARPVATALPRPARIEPCCWVTQPSAGGRLPRYCETDSLPGLPYCAVHAKAAYPAVKQRLGNEHPSMDGAG